MFSIIGGDGKEYGPVTVDQLRTWLANNRANLDTQARRVGTNDWLPLRAFPEFGAAGVVISPTGESITSPPERIVFTGVWGEYFRIWIVNLLLTIVTFGIYAAWAKVRKRRYFSANTRLFGHAFEYLGDPLKIFYGNLIVGAAFALYVGLGLISPLVQLPVTLLFAIAVPWFIVRALAFNARNTAWRGLRFNFTGRYGESAAAYLLWPLLVPLTLGLIFPLVAKKQKEFIVNRHAYGTTPFTFSGETGAFYKIYGKALLFFLPIIGGYIALVVMLVIQAVGARESGGQPAEGIPPEYAGMLGLSIIVAVPLAFIGAVYLRARLFNYVWNHTTLAGNHFSAAMRARNLLWLHFVHSLLTLVTFGLMHPWAAVRMVKYQLGCLEVRPAGNLDTFVAASQPPIGALGEVANDFFDFDIGFGL